MSLHENGPWSIENGLFINKYGCSTNKPAIFIDKETGCMLKSGDSKMVIKYAETVFSKYNNFGLFNLMAKPCMLITFDDLNKHLSKDEICTMMNYMQNSIGPKLMNQLLDMSENELHVKLAQLQNIGF